MKIHGTLIAAFVVRDQVFLFSDGRVVDRDSKRVINDFSKVHKLTDFAGMLTAGEYIPTLREDISRNCTRQEIVYVDGVVKIARQLLEQILANSREIIEEGKKKYNLYEIVIFVFIAGFDKDKNPHLFYLDNRSNPPFEIQEQALFTTETDLEIGAMSTGSGKTENPAPTIIKHLKRLLNQAQNETSLDKLLTFAFDETKEELGRQNRRIGGRTFLGRIDPIKGYTDVPWK